MELQASDGNDIELDFGQRGGMAITAARVSVDFVDQLFDGMDAITDNQGGLTSGSRNQFISYNQSAVVTAGQEFFYQNFAIASGRFVGLVEQFALNNVDRNALALVAILGLDHNGKSNAECNLPSIF